MHEQKTMHLMKKYVISQWRNSIQVSYLNLIPFFQMRKKEEKNPNNMRMTHSLDVI